MKSHHSHDKLLLLSTFALFFTIFSSLSLSQNPRSQVAAIAGAGSNLVAHYTFDDGTAKDFSGNGLDGSRTGTVSTAGKISGGIEFDGADDRVSIPSYSQLSFGTGSFSVAFWVNPTSLPVGQFDNAGGLVSKFASNGGSGWNTYLGSDGKVGMYVRSETTVYGRLVAGTISTNQWNHFVFVVDRGANKIFAYQNGTLLSSTMDLTGFGDLDPDDGHAMLIGAIREDLSFYPGKIDDVRIFNRPLSQSDVTELAAYTGAVTGGGGVTESPPPAQTSLGSHIYFSESGVGAGSSCSSALPVSWLNTATNWGTGGGQIGAGETAHLCGTISTPITILGSGTSGSPITILFESGAKMVAPTWYTGAISASGKNYIVIDGGSNGIIQATGSGTGYNNTAGSTGVSFTNVNNSEIKNLSVLGMFVRPPGAGDNCNNYCGTGIAVTGTFSNVAVHHNTITDARSGVGISYGPSSSGLSIYSNKISKTAWGIGGGDWPPNGSTLTNVDIYDNTITDAYPWDGNFTGCTGDCWFHINGIYIWAEQTGDTLSNIRVHGNKIGGNMGTASHITSFTWFSGNVQAPVLVYDNIYYSTSASGSASNGFISLRYCKNGTTTNPCGVYNNTFYSVNPAGLGVMAGDSTDIKNNIFSNVAGHVIYAGDPANTYKITSDYNIFYGLTSNQFKLNGGYYTPTTWQAAGYDTHSLFVDPQFVNPGGFDFHLKSTSPAVDKGTALALSGLNKDLEGSSRPQGNAWDIGAYESSNSGTGTPPPTTYLPGDFNQDGHVNSVDFSAMSGVWNTNNVLYDLNKDGTVNTLDYSIMVQNWTR